ncbi:MAG: hypothetical protein RIQ41_575 [Candidatus Parcubacteria bacterium]|jgi:hypothetical protein
MKQDDQNMWNVVYSLFFFIIAISLLRILYIVHGTLPTTVSFFDLTLITLASFRLTRLFVYDKITKFLRDLFQHSEEEYTQEGVTYTRKVERTHGPLRTAYELLVCPWCFSVWAALFVLFAYFLNKELFWLPICILAVSGAATALQISVSMVGWIAENKKLEASDRQ